nr:hypothetical protein [uncultured Undibacterium sp.]
MTVPSKNTDASTESEAEHRIVLIDTNCYLRLYYSPVKPFLGQIVECHQLLTLTILVDEFLTSPRLKKEYAWLESTVKAEDLKQIVLPLTSFEHASVLDIMREHRDYVDDLLEDYCHEKNILYSKRLSNCDLELLATAIEKEAIIATDEWPLEYVVNDLMAEPDEGYNIGILTSIDILYLLECANKLSHEDTIKTVRSWMQNDEKLPRAWRQRYKTLFREDAPTL